MIFLIGVHHKWQNPDNIFFPDIENEIEKYKTDLELIINENHINKIFEEWGQKFPLYNKSSVTEKFIRDKFDSKINYYQIDPDEKTWPHKTWEYSGSKEKIIAVYDYRENSWVKTIKSELKEHDNGLLVVGNGHVQNRFFDYKLGYIVLDNSLQNKLQKAGLKFQIIYWKEQTLRNSFTEEKVIS